MSRFAHLSLFLFLPFFGWTQPPAGSLFIIGGGQRPAALVQAMLDKASLSDTSTIVILPMASSEPDSAAWYGEKQFTDRGFPADRIYSLFFTADSLPAPWIEQVRSAGLIYITGGDQVRFMEVVLDTDLYGAIRAAHNQGAMIAGTSAGAAVMSRLMITGNEYKHPEYTGDFRTIEADNLELAQGLDLLPGAIVDQHFIWRMRMNRLITVALENPGYHCLGIDESTALYVRRGFGQVVGEGQVIWLLNNETARKQDGLLGGRDLQMHVLLPGDRIRLD